MLQIIAILIVILLAIQIWPAYIIAAAFFVAYKIYEHRFFRSDKFLKIKRLVSDHIQDCNDLNDHIEKLKGAQLGANQKQYGHSTLQDSSRWNFKRPEFKRSAASACVHDCSRSVCSNSRKDPLKYVCKYFEFKADEQTLADFEGMLNDYSAVEEGKTKLSSEKNEILSGVKTEIPFLIKTFSSKRLSRELGFKSIDLSDAYFSSFLFRYISPGGNASIENMVTMDIDNLDAMVRYLNDRIKWKKSVAGQRALMTSALREEILDRDDHTCCKCGVRLADEPHLLLEIDHVIPISKGGMTTVENLQTLCWRCNRSKGAKLAV